jgi:hypothetical protein
MALSIETQEEQCDGIEPFWYERTAYRKIPYSSCGGGDRPDRGKQHHCPGLIGGAGLGGLFWGSVTILPFVCAAVAGWWWYTSGGRPGAIRLGEHRAFSVEGGPGVLSTAASIPYFLIGVTQASWAFVVRKVPFLEDLFAPRAPYRQVPLDDDAEVLATYEDE